MKKIIINLLCISYFLTSTAKADFFGGDLPLLAQILSNSVQQLAELKAVVGAGEDSLNLARDINKGINDSLTLYRTVFPNAEAGIFSDWKNSQEAVRKLQLLYGLVVASPESPIETNTDKGIAEAVALNNSVFSYSKQIDDIGEQIKIYSHSVSPGGAQKLTAQTQGVMLHVMNQSLRAQATNLKLQAQTLAIQNHKDKEMTRYAVETSNRLKSAMTNEKTKFEIPRF